MIQLRINPYTLREVKELDKALGFALDKLESRNCHKNVCCDECEVKHVCDDLENAKNYLKNIVRASKEEQGGV